MRDPWYRKADKVTPSSVVRVTGLLLRTLDGCRCPFGSLGQLVFLWPLSAAVLSHPFSDGNQLDADWAAHGAQTAVRWRTSWGKVAKLLTDRPPWWTTVDEGYNKLWEEGLRHMFCTSQS